LDRHCHHAWLVRCLMFDVCNKYHVRNGIFNLQI
jgi:hypothetical protein